MSNQKEFKLKTYKCSSCGNSNIIDNEEFPIQKEQHGKEAIRNLTDYSSIVECSDNNSNSTKVKIPTGLDDLLLDFTVNVLSVKQPIVDLYQHALNYFTFLVNTSNSKSASTNGTPSSSILINNKMNTHEAKEENLTTPHTTRVNIQLNDDEEELCDQLKEIEMINNRKNSNTRRRISVFSKSFDPEEEEKNQYHLNEGKNQLGHNKMTSFEDSFQSGQEEFKCLESIRNEPYEKNSQYLKKNPDQIEKLKQVLKSIILFKHLYDEDIEAIIDSMFERKCQAGEIIINEGHAGNYFYIVVKGTYEVFIKSFVNNNKNNEKNDAYSYNSENNLMQSNFLDVKNKESSNDFGKKVIDYEDKGYFGELALMYNQPRSATIICKKEGILYCMNRIIFQKLVISRAYKRRKMYEEFLNSVPLLKESMNDHEISQVASCLTSKSYSAGELIFKQNDVANGIYFIETGCVKIIQEVEEEDGKFSGKELSKLKRGEYFGELALVNKAPRSASAYAFDEEENFSGKNVCKLAFMDIDAFERLMGPCIELLKDKIMSYKIKSK